jgi:glycosyltransferase involved in cell wall biosynthesis
MATRILYIITKANWGGAQRYVYDLAQAALEAGYEVAVAFGEEGELARRLKEAGIRTHLVRGLSRDVGFTRDAKAFFELVRLFKHERPDVVHINSSKAGGLGVLAARMCGVPKIIFTAHAWAFNESRPLWQKIIIWIFAGVTVVLSHKTICVSDAGRKDLRRFPFAARKMSVIHNGIACPTLMPREEARRTLLNNKIEKYWIGMVSELHPTKQIADAVSAMALLAEEHPYVILVVLGEGSERTSLEEQIKRTNLTDRVFLLGFIPNAAALLHAFDLFLHSSRSEALAYAILEAGCASLPVVATAVGGIPEIITNGREGLLVPSGSPEAIARALDSLIRNSAHAKSLGAALHTRVLTVFSKEKMVRATFALY